MDNAGSNECSAAGPRADQRTHITPLFAIGDTGPCGGLVFHITEGGLHGLEAATADQGFTTWGCTFTATGATGTAIGSGASNTSVILEARCTTGLNAADLASNFAGGGCTGWFLPSQDELNEMYTQLHLNGLGDFATVGVYYSSSEVSNSNNVRGQVFANGNQGGSFKGNTNHVRAGRVF